MGKSNVGGIGGNGGKVFMVAVAEHVYEVVSATVSSSSVV
jgi:hypothetical protein